jgi:hypothetical protein
MTDRREVVAWLSSLEDAEFARVVAWATQRRQFEEPPRFTLAEVIRPGVSGSKAPEVSLVAISRFDEPWGGTEPFAVRGVCGHCGVRLISQVKEVACPACGQATGVA